MNDQLTQLREKIAAIVAVNTDTQDQDDRIMETVDLLLPAFSRWLEPSGVFVRHFLALGSQLYVVMSDNRVYTLGRVEGLSTMPLEWQLLPELPGAAEVAGQYAAMRVEADRVIAEQRALAEAGRAAALADRTEPAPVPDVHGASGSVCRLCGEQWPCRGFMQQESQADGAKGVA